jgi:hypothetical protein
MTPYFVCYAVLVIALVLGFAFDKLRLAAIVAFIPMFVLIVQRGIVGTDTAVYIQQFDVIRYRGILAADFEPGFSALVGVLTKIFPDSFDIVILLSGVTAIIMLCAGLLLERSPILFMTIVLPYFMLDMTMNGLRYGLAFSIVALGAAALVRGKTELFIACSVIAASCQVSAVLLAVGLWILVEVRIKTLIGIAVSVIIAVTFFQDRVIDKISANSDLAGLGGSSGLAPLIATAAIVTAIRYRDRQVVGSHLTLLAIVAMQLLSFGISRYYYAGLRLQSLFLFLLYLFTAVMARKSAFDITKDRLFMWCLGAAMIISSASRLKNFNDDVDGPSPFNPYYSSAELNHSS